MYCWSSAGCSKAARERKPRLPPARDVADGVAIRKPSDGVAADARLACQPDHPWVSRGGAEARRGARSFRLRSVGRVCLDVGASTGGFTEVLLARGARRVYAVDVGRGQLHARLRDARGSCRWRKPISARSILRGLLSRQISSTMDVSFISLKLILPALDRLPRRPAQLVALIKPQFEAGKKHGQERHRARSCGSCGGV